MKRKWTFLVIALWIATAAAALADSCCGGCKKKADKPATTNAPAQSGSQSASQ